VLKQSELKTQASKRIDPSCYLSAATGAQRSAIDWVFQALTHGLKSGRSNAKSRSHGDIMPTKILIPARASASCHALLLTCQPGIRHPQKIQPCDRLTPAPRQQWLRD
jgi:hypothetical protein